jgi:Putative Ig domain/Domain of unknown function (DUF4114)
LWAKTTPGGAIFDAVKSKIDQLKNPISTGTFGSGDLVNGLLAFFDSVDGFIIDSQGRRLGYSKSTGVLNEIPNSVWLGQSEEGIGFIKGTFDPAVKLELSGLGVNHTVAVFGIQGSKLVSAESSGFLANAETKQVPLNFTEIAVSVNKSFTLSIPDTTFKDPDINDVLNYSVTLNNGNPLPTWLKFDAITNSFTGTPTGNDIGTIQLKVTATDKSNAVVSSTFKLNVIPNSSSILQKSTEDIWTVKDNGKVKVAITGKNSNQLNEVGVFKIAADNTINGIAVGAAGFTQAALANSTTLFTALPDKTTDGLDLSHILNVTNGDRLGFFLVSNGSIQEDLKYNYFKNVVFSIDSANPNNKDYLQVTEKAGAFTLSWEQGNDNTFQDLSISLSTDSSPDSPLSSITSLQSKPEGEILDLRAFAGQTLKATFNVKREAYFTDVIGFYKIEDAEGTVTTLTGIKLKPQDKGYKQAALDNKIEGLDLVGENNKTITIDKNIIGGAMYAPYLVINGNPGFDNRGKRGIREKSYAKPETVTLYCF